MSVQTLFGRAISNLLPSAIPTQLERIDEFAIGKVLIHKKKPRKFLSWRHHDLHFTGHSLSSLLADDQNLTIATSSNFLFKVEKDTSSATVKVNLDAELSLRESLVKMEAKLKADEMKTLTISTGLGKVTRISTNLLPDCLSFNLKVKVDHPIVKEAMDKGRTLFVITSLYESEHCNVEVSMKKTEDETLSGGASAEAGAEAGETVGDSKTATQVISREMPTPIAFLLLKLVIKDNGEIVPKLNSGLSHQFHKSNIEFVDSPDGGLPSKYQSHITRPRFSTNESLNEWVVVDIVSGKSSEVLKEVPEEPTPSQTTETQPQKAKEETSVDQSSTDTSSSAQPVVEEAVKVRMVSEELRIPPRSGNEPMGVPDDDYDGANLHYVYSMKDFQPFESSNYDGILKESRDWVDPLVSNKKLQSVFLEYCKPPQTFEKLEKLSEFLLDYGNALRTDKPPPKSPSPAIEPILENLSSFLSEKLDEVTSIIVVAEACTEFPQHIIKKAIALPKDKRYTLIEFIRQTPYGADRHVYSDVGPFKDPDLYPIMTRMGFSLPSSSQRLVYTNPDDKEDDMLAAGLVMLLGTEVKQ